MSIDEIIDRAILKLDWLKSDIDFMSRSYLNEIKMNETPMADCKKDLYRTFINRRITKTYTPFEYRDIYLKHHCTYP